MSWLSDSANWFHNNLGFGAIDNVTRALTGISFMPSALRATGDSFFLPSSSGGTSDGGTSDLDNSGSAVSAAAREEMQYNSSEADRAREWQEYMRNTQLSSAFKQARENGINPYVMFNGGSVSAPGTSAASYSGYASSERSSSQSGLNALLAAYSALAVAKTPRTTVVVK